MFRNVLLFIVLIFSAFLVITENTILMPLFVILLGIAIVPAAVGVLKKSDNESDKYESYINIVVFSIILAYFLFLTLSGHLY